MKQLTYKTDSGEIAPKKLDGLIMQAIKMYGMDPKALDDIRDAVLDDYTDSDISQVSVQDIVEIMDASGFEPGDDEDEEADDIFYDKAKGKWVKRKLKEDDGKMSLTFKQFLVEGADDLEQAQKQLANAKKNAASPSANWQTRDELSAAHDKVANIKKQAKRDGGKLNSASIIVPDDKVEQIVKDLHAMWKVSGKAKDGQRTPWQTFHDRAGTVAVRFNDYDTKNTGSGNDVDDMINHVKKFEV